MKRLSTFMGKLALLMLGVCFFAACSDDDGPSYSTATVQNTELLSILKDAKYGLTFNENGNLLLDDAAKNITKLDLSGTKLSPAALSELSILPNLTDVDLSNNDYSISFDFSNLPSQITGVDLTGNELYEFPGLVNIETQENGDEKVTVLHPLTKLYLPEGAKYNCNEIVAFYQNTSGVDMQMQNEKGVLSSYNTLREVPDAITRANLQAVFPSMFEGNSIDISKRLVKSDERSKNVSITESGVTSVEGVEYILMNKGYQGVQVSLVATEKCKMPYLKLDEKFTQYVTKNVSVSNLDISEAVNLCVIQITSDEGLKELDLSHLKKFGQRGYDTECSFNDGSSLYLVDCENLKTLTLPSKATITPYVVLCVLPSLESIDLSNFGYINALTMGNLPKATIKYPVFTQWGDFDSALFAITEEIYNKEETKPFLDLYHEKLNQGANGSFPQGFGLKVYRWKSKHYNN